MNHPLFASLIAPFLYRLKSIWHYLITKKCTKWLDEGQLCLYTLSFARSLKIWSPSTVSQSEESTHLKGQLGPRVSDVMFLDQRRSVGPRVSRGAFFVWRAPIVSWPRIVCSQVRILRFLELSRNAVNKSVWRKKRLFLTSLKQTCNEWISFFKHQQM